MIDTYCIRDVADSDLSQICRFPQNREELLFMYPRAEYPLTIQQLRDAIYQRSDSKVLESGEQVVAFANFYEVSPNSHCTIGNVIVNPSHRGSGAATFLVREMERIAKQKYQVPEVRISCFNSNVAALLLYSKLGYLPFTIEKRTGTDGGFLALIKLKRMLDTL
mgnify:CR=1 FL=1